MTGSLHAELLVVRKRASTWILHGIWATLALVFAYVVPYATYLNNPTPESLADVVPENLVGTLMAGFPFFGGVLALMLGVLAFGSEYGWGTLKTLFTQRPGRLHVFGAKLLALAATLVASYSSSFRWGPSRATPSPCVKERTPRGRPCHFSSAGLPPAGSVWAAFGVLLSILFRGTALAVGVGILYALVIEGLLSALATQVSLLDPLVELFVRAGGYSLIVGLGASPEDAGDRGPGSYSGPFVGSEQALLVLLSYLAAFLLVAGWRLRRRDVT